MAIKVYASSIEKLDDSMIGKKVALFLFDGTMYRGIFKGEEGDDIILSKEGEIISLGFNKDNIFCWFCLEGFEHIKAELEIHYN